MNVSGSDYGSYAADSVNSFVVKPVGVKPDGGKPEAGGVLPSRFKHNDFTLF